MKWGLLTICSSWTIFVHSAHSVCMGSERFCPDFICKSKSWQSFIYCHFIQPLRFYEVCFFFIMIAEGWRYDLCDWAVESSGSHDTIEIWLYCFYREYPNLPADFYEFFEPESFSLRNSLTFITVKLNLCYQDLY